MKKVVVLGITGSIGTSAVEVIKRHSHQFKIVLATAHNNKTKLLALQKEMNISKIALTNQELKDKSKIGINKQIYYGKREILQLLTDSDYDIVINAISGSAGLEYSIKTIERGKDLALANKESLVMAGHLIKYKLAKTDTKIIPVDSEHSAIFQAIGESSLDEIKNLVLTASGGPFRDLPLIDFDKINLEQTLDHPTWDMGPKVTIDSATMMNKGLEVIEAHWLFNKEYDNIKSVIHPQSIIHSFIEYIDGSILAQMSLPTMKLPILFALSYPKHIESNLSKTSIIDLPDLSFRKINKERYPLFFLARKVGKEGGLLPTVMNAANEAAIELFLNNKIAFKDIYTLVYKTVLAESNESFPDLLTIIETNKKVYNKVKKDYNTILING